MNPEINLIVTGRDQLDKKNYQSAEGIFKKVIQLNPGCAEGYFELGKIYYIQEKYFKAIENLERSILLDQGNPHAHLLLAKSYRGANRYQDAIAEFKKIFESGHQDKESYKELFEIYRVLNKFDFTSGEIKFALEGGYEKELFQLVQRYNLDGKFEQSKELAIKLLNSVSESRLFLRNKLLNELEIAQGKTILSSKPRRLTVTLSNQCNLSCIMCLTRHTKWNIPQRTIEEIYALFPYLEKVMWQGGEVFALDYFDDLLSHGFKYPDLRHSIVTNAQLLDEKMIEKLVTNNVELTVSVDGVSKEVYEYIRKGADFSKLVKNLRLISDLKNKYKSNMVLNLNVAVMKSNYHQLEGFIDFAKEYGFEFICLMPIHIHLKTPEDIFTNCDMEALTFITEVSPKISEKAKQYGIRLENRLPQLTEKKESPVSDKANNNAALDVKKQDNRKLLCHIPWQQLLIDYDGSVRPDCLCRIEKKAGSLLGDSTIGDIWNNNVMVEYREKILRRNYVDFCNDICFSGKITESHLKIP